MSLYNSLQFLYSSSEPALFFDFAEIHLDFRKNTRRMLSTNMVNSPDVGFFTSTNFGFLLPFPEYESSVCKEEASGNRAFR
jgi:hypothetical protein